MKLVRNLPEIFNEFGEKRKNAFLEIKEYKDKGIPVVGMYCAYFPTELAIAVGAIPVGLCSFANETITVAERDLPKSMCPLVKSSYGFAVTDKCPFFHFADLIIGETTCDGKKKMYELMSEFKPIHIMELPNSQSERGVAFWKSEVIRTKEYLEEFFHVVITDKMIRDAVHLNNQIRLSLKNLCEVMKLEPAPVLGEDIQKIVQGCKYRFDFETTSAIVNEIRERILEEYKNGKRLEKRPRILLTGCPIGGDSLKVIQAIENNGGVVVAIENCSGIRTLESAVEETAEDIYEAIARKYLATACSIMTPNDNRIMLIGGIIDEYHVDGVVEMVLTGCHATGAESVFIRKFVAEEKHIPYISIDTDYSAVDSGQISTRLAAFLEMIQSEQEEKIDIKTCYKIVLEGLGERKSKRDILEEVWNYTQIPICVKTDEQEMPEWVGIESITEEQRNWNKVEIPLPDRNGVIMAVVPKGIREAQVVELLEILSKSYGMKQRSICDLKNERPDYLWIIAENQEDSNRIAYILEDENEVPVKVHKAGETELFLSGLCGNEMRSRLITICKRNMEASNGRLLIGNGFCEIEKKEENRNLQKYILQIAGRSNSRENVYLIEDFYYELAVSYISEKLDGVPLYLGELEKLKAEDRKKGKDLYDTLYCYLRMKRNITQTAAKLHIHRNTLLPRIARINELLELDEKDGMECERLLMMMEIEELKKKNYSK